MTLAILHEDEALLLVDKPSGLLVHRGMGRDDVVLVDLVRAHTGGVVRPVHRLDRGTSGVVLFAKSAEICAQMQAAMTGGDVDKIYFALVRGVPPEAFVVDHPVPRSEGGERVSAQTAFERLEVIETQPRTLSWVQARPRTGRFHQIRRHLKHLSHPIIGDANYGKGALNREIRERTGLDRLALHASSLAFVHPVTDEPMLLEAPVPESLAEPLRKMRGG